MIVWILQPLIAIPKQTLVWHVGKTLTAKTRPNLAVTPKRMLVLLVLKIPIAKIPSSLNAMPGLVSLAAVHKSTKISLFASKTLMTP